MMGWNGYRMVYMVYEVNEKELMWCVVKEWMDGMYVIIKVNGLKVEWCLKFVLS